MSAVSPRLADPDDQRVRSEHGVAVAEFGGVLHGRRNLGEVLDHPGPDHPGVAAGSAGGDEDPVHRPELAVGHGDAAELGNSVLLEEPSPQDIAQGGGLFADLLVHEVFVAVLADCLRAPRDLREAAQHRPSRRVEGPVPLRGENGGIPIAEPHDLPGVPDHRRRIRSREELVPGTDAE